MSKLLGKAADKVLGRLVPKSSAKADSSWNEWCAACAWNPDVQNRARPYRTCHIVGGTQYCTPCTSWVVGC